MNHQNKILNFALQHHRAGNFSQAERLYRQVLAAVPNQPDALHLLGTIAIQNGDYEEAVKLIARAIGFYKKSFQYYEHLAVALQNLGRNEEAVTASLQAIALRPDNFVAYNTSGNALRELGRLEEAVAHYRKALAFKPNTAEVHLNLGNALKEQGCLEEALSHYQQALAINPLLTRVYLNLGDLFREQNKIDEALHSYRQALQGQEDNPDAHLKLGNLLFDVGKVAESIECYSRTIALKPNHIEALKNLGSALYKLGNFKEAVRLFQEALRIKPDNGLRIKIATLLPDIVDSTESIADIRRQFLDNLNQLLQEDLVVADPLKEIGNPNFFYMAYYGYNERDTMCRLARLYGRSLPDNAMRPAKLPTSAGKIRIGFVSKYFFNHSISIFFNKIIEKLAQEDSFEVILFSLGYVSDQTLQQTASTCAGHIRLPMSLKKAREIIADQSLDVLVYPDIGMEPLTYYLAFTRLAPVQCVMVGHLVTTGIPNMDYYISSELIEPGNGREHYSEKLVLLKSMPGYVVKPEMPHPSKSRSALGLPEDRNLYICPMSLQKIHPDFDQAVSGILKEDPQAEIIFFKNVHNNNWHPLIINRFRKTFPDLMDRVRFLPWANPEDFKSILMAADVALDTFHFGGGVTSYIILAAGTPIVTWPGPFMRGRMTLGCYRKIEMMDCVAHSQAEYVEIAVKLGTDRNFRDSVKNKIAKNNGLLFEDAEVIFELRDFFKKAARRTIS